ncbi:MAG: hypothetical protein RL442_1098, partial [Pseudomonadota bacterium]
EAFAIGDVIGVMDQGRLHQWDDAYSLYHRPASRLVAEFIGHGVFTPAILRCPRPLPLASAMSCCGPMTSCMTTMRP